jgi:deoxyribodipyrimidine photolyase-related protein
MKKIVVVFPHQLFYAFRFWETMDEVVLIEEYLFFKQFNFHKQKLIFHRSSMRQFADFLASEGVKTTYIESNNPSSDIRVFLQGMKGLERQLNIIDPTDNWLRGRIEHGAATNSLEIAWIETPNFIYTQKENAVYQIGRKTYFQTDFYQYNRKNRGWLMTADGKPVGGKYSFDAENRKSFKGKISVPTPTFPSINTYLEEARDYVDRNFGNNLGLSYWDKHTFYPTNREGALVWLDEFFNKRFRSFGDFEDAIVTELGKEFMFHSVLSPLINVGLLSPQEVVERTIEYATSHDLPLNSLEGFVRQITGWREFIRHVYEDLGTRQRTKNYWGFTRSIPVSFYTGETGIEPVDFAIKKALKYGYNHHIERLMILGNFMLLCEFNPDEVYRWFMEMYVDSYDWVMVPNVYGMICFADGGLMTSKPYISGSNYLVKMGGFKKSAGAGGWQAIWDALFWRFMHKQRAFFSSNPRLGMLLRTWDVMSEEKRNNHLQIAENYLQSLNQ